MDVSRKATIAAVGDLLWKVLCSRKTGACSTLHLTHCGMHDTLVSTCHLHTPTVIRNRGHGHGLHRGQPGRVGRACVSVVAENNDGASFNCTQSLWNIRFSPCHSASLADDLL